MKKFFTLLLILSFTNLNTFAAVNTTNTNEQMRQSLMSYGMEVDGFPEIREPIEDWEAGRNKASGVAWSKWLDKKRRNLNQWIDNQNEDHFKPVGWGHDYIDAKTGKWLYWAPNKPIPKDASGKVAAAWRMRVRVHNLEMMLDAARLYKLDGNVKYRDWVINEMSLYAQAYSTLPLQTWNGQSQLFTQALDEAVYSFHFIEIVRLLKSDVKASQLNTWELKLFVPMANNLMQSSIHGNNISVWIAASVSTIGNEFNLPALVQFGVDSEKGLPALLKNGVSEDYFWKENSLSYQDYVVSALYHWLYAALIRDGDSPLAQQVGLIAKNLMLSPTIVRFSNREAPMLNDSQVGKGIPNTKLWSNVWRVLPTRDGILNAYNQKNWGMLIDAPPRNVIATTLPAVESRQIPGINVAQLVSSDWQALIRYGKESSGHHTHQESMTYDLKHNGNWLFRDPGTVAYGSELHRNYFKKAQAHTGALINREGQLPWPSEGEVKRIDPINNTVEVAHIDFQNSNDVTRILKINHKQFIENTIFKIGKQKKLPVGVTYNTACKVIVANELQAAKADTLVKDGAFAYWTNRKEYKTQGNIELELHCQKNKYFMNISGADIARLLLANTPTPNKNEVLTGIYVETSLVSHSSITTSIFTQ
ncbi:MAG: heparinase II/III family protein [Methylophilaceae bacterium]